MAEQSKEQLVCGIPEEWENFHKRHTLFYERFAHLQDALNTAFIRKGSSPEPIDRFVFLYGRLCCEDFFEVLLCCGNGYGSAALKLLRSLYERAVTLEYLHRNPTELDDFLDYHEVQQHKLMVSIEETFGKGTIPEENAAFAKKRFDEVKDRFMVSGCACGRKKLNHTWSKLDFISMIKKGGSFGAIVVPGYYLPLRQAHATFAALLSRLEETDESTSFKPSSQHKPADIALVTGHNILLKVLAIHDDRFKVPGLKEKIELCVMDFSEMYQ